MTKLKDDWEGILRIIDLCRALQTERSDPFELDIRSALKFLRDRLPSWKGVNELLLDSEALNSLATIIKLQNEWVGHRASSLYVDPILMEFRVRMMAIETLARAMVESWFPIVGMDFISSRSLERAIAYWNGLAPLSERFKETTYEAVVQGFVTLQELVKLKMLSDEEFDSGLMRIRKELLDRIFIDGKIEYRDFVRGKTFEDTILRAYLTSFLVSEGYAQIESKPLEDRILLVVEGKNAQPSQPRSVAISLLVDKMIER